ncbi:MAG: WYL domain-containing protein, partial [Eubacterium sp.]|nr:WYL domain-containing protein [Eubacterium sp.]
LYEQGTIEYFDRYSDGDSFDNPKYIENFHIILKAVKQHKKLKIKYTGRQWKDKEFICSPIKLQYSSKDDKFRLKAIAYKKMFTLNLSRIEACEMTHFDIHDDLKKYESKKDTLVFELLDDRNALERVMLSFSHLEKETQRQEDNRYRVTLKYDRDDETEILIRILSFGPLIRVISPDSFIENLKKRIDNQMNCGV